MKTLLTRRDIALLPRPNEYHLVLDNTEPPHALVTSAFILAFEDERLLMSKLASRGWDIPGGHVEAGETPEETARRELYEETCTSVTDVSVLGYDEFVVRGPAPEGYRYPLPISYQLFYCARVAALEPFTPTLEVLERGFFAPAKAREVQWVQGNGELYTAALEWARLYTRPNTSGR